MTKLTALEKLADNCTVAANAATTARNLNKEHGATATRLRSQGYNEGKNAAYNDAHAIMKAELKRLRNLWQNGALTYDAFNVGD